MFAADTPPAARPVPILVELFTSEGCSTCPPADVLLERFDSSQPMPGAQLIVLSEHVDYWDKLGWKDPFSSSIFTDRQTVYASHFGLASPYTPQMVVDGTSEFVGNNTHLAEQAIQKAANSQKVSVRISSISSATPGKLHASVEADALPVGPNADVYFVVALNHAESQVERGENKGHHLAYVAVVQSLAKIGSVDRNHNLLRDRRQNRFARGSFKLASDCLYTAARLRPRNWSRHWHGSREIRFEVNRRLKDLSI